ncbi:hypothetical protein [Acinetobacter indicus]|uniref:hypothetical protein n=1 Tax=Acinetobacter indicus TaxID=756892 RepID=UPI001E4B54A7|nr:hypothetical protein [Acinetobacter indicus]
MLKKKLLVSLAVSICITACNASNTSSDLNMTFEQAEQLRSQAEAAPSNSDEKKEYYKRLEPIYENLAKEGNSDAQLILADIYFKALSGTYDAKKSFEWTKNRQIMEMSPLCIILVLSTTLELEFKKV